MKPTVKLWALAVALAAAAVSPAQGLKDHATLSGHSEGVQALAFSPDGKTLASGGRGYQQMPQRRWGELKLWDVASGGEKASLEGHEDGIGAIAFSPAESTLATSASGDVILWDMAAGKPRLTLKVGDHNLGGLAFTTDGKMVAVGSYHGAKLWDVATGQEKAVLKGPGLGTRLAFSPDLKTLAVPFHQDVDLWDTATGKVRLTLEDHRGPATVVQFSHDGKIVVVGSNRMLDDRSYKCEVRFWDAASGELLRTLKPDANYLRGLSLSPDGKLLALTGGKSYDRDNAVILIHLAEERELARAGLKAIISEPLFSLDGRFLAATAGKEIKLWEVVPTKK